MPPRRKPAYTLVDEPSIQELLATLSKHTVEHAVYSEKFTISLKNLSKAQEAVRKYITSHPDEVITLPE